MDNAKEGSLRKNRGCPLSVKKLWTDCESLWKSIQTMFWNRGEKAGSNLVSNVNPRIG